MGMGSTGKRIWVAALLAAWTSVAAGQSITSASGQQDPIDNLGGTARAIAMGSAFAGVANDASAMIWNPAGLANLRDIDLSLNHSSWLAQTFQEELLVGMPLPGGGLGLSTHYVGYGSFEGRDANGFLTSSYSADQIGLGLGWGQRIAGGLSAGVVLHGNQMTLAGTSSTLVGADLGLMFKTQEGWGFGASYQNVGFSSNGQPVASAVRLGASKTWKDRTGTSFLAALGGDIEPNGNDSVQAGMEFCYHSAIYLRAGYDLQLQDTGFTGIQGLTAGAGVQIASIKIDYAFVPYGELGNVHLVSLGYSFGPAAKPAPVAQNPTVPVALPAVTPVVPTAQPATPVPTPAQPQPTVAPHPLPDNGPKTPERTITMEFEVPTDEGLSQAKALAQEGKTTEAILSLKAIIDKDPKNSSAWHALGDVYFKIGRKDYAIQCFETYLKLKPNDRSLADWLENYKGVKP